MDTVRGKSEPVLLIEAPPRHGKSTNIAKFLPAWYLGRHPERQVILTSASDRLAERWGRKAKETLGRYGKSVFGVGISEKRKSVSDWETHAGGGMTTAGVGGDVMGRDGDLLIVDDFLKNSEAALSETIKDKQWDWWQSTFSTRLEPGGCIIVMATRWGEDDLIGKIKKSADDGEGLPYRALTLRAIGEENDPWDWQQEGQALWPERWPLGLTPEDVIHVSKAQLTHNGYGQRVVGLNLRRSMMDLFWWSALYQQRPSRHGKVEWPDWYFDGLLTPDWPDRFELSVMALDPSKGRKSGDYSAIVFVGLCGGKLWVWCDIQRRPEEKLVSDFLSAFYDLQPTLVGLEANSFQNLLAPMINHECQSIGRAPPPIQLFDQTEGGGKEKARLRRLGPYLQSRQLRLYERSPGSRLMLKQLREYPLSDHDDGPDALEAAIRLMLQLASGGYNEIADDDILVTV